MYIYIHIYMLETRSTSFPFLSLDVVIEQKYVTLIRLNFYTSYLGTQSTKSILTQVM